METQVKLQEPFSYELWPIIILGIIVIGMALVYVVMRIVSASKKKKTLTNGVGKQKVKNIPAIKDKYLKELINTNDNLVAGKITNRVAYQKMSVDIRKFVHEVTGIQVQNYTLTELKSLNMPVLTELIAEYYEPEFALYEGKQGEINKEKELELTCLSIEKTKRAISRWN